MPAVAVLSAAPQLSSPTSKQQQRARQWPVAERRRCCVTVVMKRRQTERSWTEVCDFVSVTRSKTEADAGGRSLLTSRSNAAYCQIIVSTDIFLHGFAAACFPSRATPRSPNLSTAKLHGSFLVSFPNMACALSTARPGSQRHPDLGNSWKLEASWIYLGLVSHVVPISGGISVFSAIRRRNFRLPTKS